MRYNNLDLNLLVALRALLTEKNVTQAGETICLTQSAMSGILARLRAYFGDPLIFQVGRKMQLTPLAERLVGPVGDLLLRVDAVLGMQPSFDPGTTKRNFKVVAADYVSNVLILDLLRELEEEAPGVRVELLQPDVRRLAELDAGEVDFVFDPPDDAPPPQMYQTLFEDTYHVVVDRANGNIGESIDLAQYLSLGHVVFHSGPRGFPFFERWFMRAQLGERRVEVTANSFNLLPQLVIGTRRIATMHTRLASHYAQFLPIRLVRPEFQTPRFVELLHWHKYRDTDPATAWLRARIVARAQALPTMPD